MPYGVALAVWQAVTLGLYVLAIHEIIRSSFRGAPATSGMTSLWLLLALAYRAVLINIGHGQNGSSPPPC